MKGLTEGRIVHFVTPYGLHRPAIITNVMDKDSGSVNLQVFTDSLNDLGAWGELVSPEFAESIASGLVWQNSIPFNEDALESTWHWIEPA